MWEVDGLALRASMVTSKTGLVAQWVGAARAIKAVSMLMPVMMGLTAEQHGLVQAQVCAASMHA